MNDIKPHGAPPVLTFHDYAGMIDAFRAIKDHLGLSNGALDELCNFASGHCDKLLGPTGTRGFGPLTLDAMLWALAVRVEIRIDVDRAREMEAHWEKRFAPNVRRETTKVSKVIIERARPHVMRDFARSGGLASSSQLTSQLARQKGGKNRMRKLSRRQRRELAQKGGRASAAKRKAIAAAAVLRDATLLPAPPLEPCASQCP